MKKLLTESEANQRDLIHILHKVQAEMGYISPEAIAAISKHLKISENEIYGVLTFYKAFSLKPRGEHLVTICMGTACHVRGAPRILDEFKRGLCIEPGETSEDNLFTLETVNCVGASWTVEDQRCGQADRRNKEKFKGIKREGNSIKKMEKINATRLEELKAEILDSRKDQKTCITVCGGTGCHASDVFRLQMLSGMRLRGRS